MGGVSREQIDGLMAASTFRVSKVGQKTCMVVCVLPSGFEIVATSACVDPADYSEEVGMSICNKKIADKLWELEGYRSQCEGAKAETALSGTYQDRVRAEKEELDGRLDKLQAFIGTERYTSLSDAEQERMILQVKAMCSYSYILADRIAAFE